LRPIWYVGGCVCGDEKKTEHAAHGIKHKHFLLENKDNSSSVVLFYKNIIKAE